MNLKSLSVGKVWFSDGSTDDVSSKVRIGWGVISMNLNKSNVEKTVEIISPVGVVGSVTLLLRLSALDEVTQSVLLSSYQSKSSRAIPREIRRKTQTKRIGLGKATMGFVPKYPIVIVPGIILLSLYSYLFSLFLSPLLSLSPSFSLSPSYSPPSRLGQLST
jgi:hypothetical protein